MAGMTHDEKCELNRKTWHPVCQVDGCRIYLPGTLGRHCHCGSRAFPLCEGCGTGQHLKHNPKQPCICDLCSDEAVA